MSESIMHSGLDFNSRRSTVICRNGCVACSQPLAAGIGIDILKAGGNAADAAVGVAAALNVTEPCSTGIGGDAFCLFYEAKSKRVQALNGSGRAPSDLNLDLLIREGFSSSKPFPKQHGHAVTVPGAAAALVDTVDKFGSGKLSLSQILAPAIELAETGYPVQQVTANSWNEGKELLQDPKNTHGKDLLIKGRAPRHGEVMRMPYLAQTMRALGTHGKKAFYEGRVATAIVDVVQKFGGVMSLEDLKNHVTTYEDPISTDYRGYRLWEIPPNGHGMAALMTLNILEGYSISEMSPNSVEYLHLLTEALKLSLADTTWYCADPSQITVPIDTLLSKKYIAKRRELIHTDSVMKNPSKGDTTLIGNDTVYFTTADKDGNACSFINSNFKGFGSALVPEGCGFTLHNRGTGFSLDPKHPNVLSPNKRPYHTIIPAMLTNCKTGEMAMSYGVMGGYMQPQGHVQVLVNMLDFGMNPQQALDQPRINICGGLYGFNLAALAVETGISQDVISGLQKLGHNINGPIGSYDRKVFGRGQVIAKETFWIKDSSLQLEEQCYWTGSDPRADGMVIGY